jgi:translation elongation factor EF-Ts
MALRPFYIVTTGKPADVVEKMTEGRVRKFLAEITLLEQNHMVEAGNPRIADLVAKTAQELGCNVEVSLVMVCDWGQFRGGPEGGKTWGGLHQWGAIT